MVLSNLSLKLFSVKSTERTVETSDIQESLDIYPTLDNVSESLDDLRETHSENHTSGMHGESIIENVASSTVGKSLSSTTFAKYSVLNNTEEPFDESEHFGETMKRENATSNDGSNHEGRVEEGKKGLKKPDVVNSKRKRSLTDYNCNLCTKRYKQKANLYRHIRENHNVDEQMCSTCNQLMKKRSLSKFD